MDKTKAKIQELCPDVLEPLLCNHECIDCLMGKSDNFQSITLAVVLRAITIKQFPDSGQYTAMGSKKMHDVLRLWILSEDNYDQQSEECKQFIGSLLGV